MAVLLIRATSPRTKTRSQGTSTSSKNTTQSISSKRDASGWSKRERPRSELSPQRNFSPRGPPGMAEVLAEVFVVASDVLTELRTALREVPGGGRPGGEGDVHEVGRAPHHPARRARPVRHHDAPPLELLARAGDDEGQAHALTARRRHVRHVVTEARIVLHVVQRGDGAHAVGQPRVRGHVLDALAAQPDLALLVLEPLDVLPSGPRAHGRHLGTSGVDQGRSSKTETLEPGAARGVTRAAASNTSLRV